MYKILESSNSNGICFIKQYCDDKTEKVIEKKMIQVLVFHTKTSHINDFFMFYDPNMQPISEAISFINFDGMNYDSRNYKIIGTTALKLFYDFIYAFQISIRDMSEAEAHELLDFIKGISKTGVLYNTFLITKRSNETILSYLKVIRKYLKYLGYEDHIILKRSNKASLVDLDEYGHREIVPYDINVKTQESDEVPAYISVDEYLKILDVINRSSKMPLRDSLICRLMFENGLRIGEVLGLTLEDFNWRKKIFSRVYYLELRNRISDKPYQSCKSAMKVRTSDDYNAPEYRQKGVGYQKIILSQALAEQLLEYIENAHFVENDDYMKRRDMYSKADEVPTLYKKAKENYYIFLNSIGRPLSSNTWDKTLRKYFVEAGLHVDSVARENNLNHRFRHGYAMFLTNNMGLDDFTVQTLMRHRSISSTAIYHKPTEDDVEELQEKLVESWADALMKGRKDT